MKKRVTRSSGLRSEKTIAKEKTNSQKKTGERERKGKRDKLGDGNAAPSSAEERDGAEKTERKRSTKEKVDPVKSATKGAAKDAAKQRQAVTTAVTTEQRLQTRRRLRSAKKEMNGTPATGRGSKSKAGGRAKAVRAVRPVITKTIGKTRKPTRAAGAASIGSGEKRKQKWGTVVKRVPRKGRTPAGSPEVLRSSDPCPVSPQAPLLNEHVDDYSFDNSAILQYSHFPTSDLYPLDLNSVTPIESVENQEDQHVITNDQIEAIQLAHQIQSAPVVPAPLTPPAPSESAAPFAPSASRSLDKDAPLLSLWVGVFTHSTDPPTALDVFNGIEFTTILESEESGTQQRFDHKTHRFGTCHLVRLSRRLAHANDLNRYGRFFLLDVPLARFPNRNTVYHCDLTFPRNDIIPTNQSGLRFPTAMRFATRLLTEHPGHAGKTPLHFHPFFRGTHFYNLAATHGLTSVCTFAAHGGRVYFPRSFAQIPMRKRSAGGNVTLSSVIERDPLLIVCRRTLDPYVPLRSPVRPAYFENATDGARPVRRDNRDLLSSRRARSAVLHVQNEFYRVPGPRRAYALIDGERRPGLFGVKRKELGALLNMQHSWLSEHMPKCGVPNWPFTNLNATGAALRRLLIRMMVCAEYAIKVLESTVEAGVRVQFPRKSILRVRRLRRKIRTYRRARRAFVQPGVDSDGSDDDLSREGLWDEYGRDEDGRKVKAGSDGEWEPITGIKKEEAELKTARKGYFGDEFIMAWNDRNYRDQDFMIDPMWDVVLPWSNAPLTDRQKSEDVEIDGFWYQPADEMYLGRQYVLPVGEKSDDHGALHVTSMRNMLGCFTSEDSNTDDSCTAQPVEDGNIVAEAAGGMAEERRTVESMEMGPCGNFVMGGRARRIEFGCARRGRGARLGFGKKRQDVRYKNVEVEGADRVARRIRLDLIEKYPQLEHVVPPVVVKFPFRTPDSTSLYTD